MTAYALASAIATATPAPTLAPTLAPVCVQFDAAGNPSAIGGPCRGGGLTVYVRPLKPVPTATASALPRPARTRRSSPLSLANLKDLWVLFVFGLQQGAKPFP